ncbi:fibroblast growth factor 1 isoform X2 [Paramuricea clavata]|uniref:Fibroblast growth factor 1 isoform X2 n=1 Tax=Paramuricea clavata TaxID=317549 RepID=A0A6S7GYH2_PARCT|nr:fibroblast growth factor 1 isoform X2 [Paramuricea clavata]
MARFGFLSFTCCCVLIQLQQIVAPPPPIIEAYKPTSGLTESVQDTNSGFGGLKKLNKMLTKLQHKIDDINIRRKIMEAQMKSPFGLSPSRMEAALDYTYTLIPSIVYRNQKIVSANGVFLQIFPDGTANGTRDDTSPYANITVEMVGFGRTVKILIKGEKSKQYLTCSKSKNGRFLAAPNKSFMSVFLTPRPPQPKKDKALRIWKLRKYVNLQCERYNWLLGFRHNDKLKKGKHSRGWQLDSWFMIMSSY